MERMTERTVEGMLHKYRKLERKKELLELPVAVGDTVYRIFPGDLRFPGMVYECKVTGVKQEGNDLFVKLYANKNNETYFLWLDKWYLCQLGREFFLTKEEAEAALEAGKAGWKEHLSRRFLQVE